MNMLSHRAKNVIREVTNRRITSKQLLGIKNLGYGTNLRPEPERDTKWTERRPNHEPQGERGVREVSRRQTPGPARPRQNGGARLVPVQNVYTYGGSRKAKILEWRRLKKCPKKNPNKKRILMIRQELTRKTSPQCLEWSRIPNSSWKRSMEQIFHQTIWRRVEHDEAKMRRTFLGSRRPQ